MWINQLKKVLKQFNEETALQCAIYSDEIYKLNCNSNKRICLSTSSPPILNIVIAKNKLFFIFRGTKDVKNVLTNADLRTLQFHNTMVHRGFLKRYEITKQLIFDTANKYKSKKIICCGHSLGGAVASIAACDLAIAGFKVSLFTFGSPQVGDQSFKKLANDNIKKSWRFVNGNDIVIKAVPIKSFFHIGNLMLIQAMDDSSFTSHKSEEYVKGIKRRNFDLIRFSLCKSKR